MIYENWVITKWSKNITDDGKSHLVNKDKVKETMKFKFRLLDDDDVIYAYGVSDKITFDPLDTYSGAYGCTGIQYKNKDTGKYEFL